MNYTEKYHLPQWEETDRIMRTDFNQMCADIESGLAGNAAAANHALAAANNAHNAADAAHNAANTAQNTANAALAAKPYVIGSYAGKKPELKITLGFRPNAVIIGRIYDASLESSDALAECALFVDGASCRNVRFEDDGFSVLAYSTAYPAVNWGGSRFRYIAFR